MAVTTATILKNSIEAKKADETFKLRVNYGYGLASLISDDGYFLTAAHVVHDKEKEKLLLIYIINPRTLESHIVHKEFEVIFADKESDIAIIWTEMESLFHLEIAPDYPKANDEIITFNQLVFETSRGHIRKVYSQKSEDAPPSFLSTAKLEPGWSGGPTVNKSGKLIGINIGKHNSSNSSIHALLDHDFIETRIEEHRNRKASSPSSPLSDPNPDPI